MKPTEFKSGMAVRSTTWPFVSGILLRKLLFYEYVDYRGHTKYRVYCKVRTTNGKISHVTFERLIKYKK